MAELTLKDLKKNSKGLAAKLTQELEKLNKGSQKYQDDDRFWSCERDSAGNGYAVIRFLPAHKSEELPFVRVWEHAFKGPTGVWYIEKSLTTLNKPDPVTEYNNKLWNTGRDEDKKTAQKYKRQLKFIANVLIVKDPKHPENEGKVKLFKFGKKIFDKINQLMFPEFEDEAERNPFDFWEGANFKLKIRQVEGYPNFDKSEFEESSEVADSDAEIEKIWNSVYPLQEFLDEKNFKSYDELKARHAKALGIIPDRSEPVSSDSDNDESEQETRAKAKKEKARRAEQEEEEVKAKEEEKEESSEDTDDDLEMFSSLAEDD
jgi:hypothetical protein